MPSHVALFNCRVLDVAAGCLRPGCFDILISDSGRIERIVPYQQYDGGVTEFLERIGVEVEDEDPVYYVHCEERTIMPGLCDGHVHVTACTADLSALTTVPESLVAVRAAKVLEGMLERGFTTVRDAGGADWGLAAAVEEGTVVGPRLLFTGHALSQTGGHGDMRRRGEDFCACAGHRGIGRVCDGVAEVRKGAREELRRGAHCIKIMASGGVSSPTDALTSTQFSREELAAVVEEAAACGTYVCAHAYTAAAITRAVEAGVRSIEHGNHLDAPTAKLMAERGAFLVPTIVTYAALARDGERAGMQPELVAKVGDLVERGKELLRVASRAGVRMAYGSDLLGELHACQLEELEIRSGVVGPQEAIRAATVNAAALFQMEDRLGQVKEGFLADLLLVEGDPYADLEVLTRPEKHLKMVIKGGKILLDRLPDGPDGGL